VADRQAEDADVAVPLLTPATPHHLLRANRDGRQS
jgi:hypothetical protein